MLTVFGVMLLGLGLLFSASVIHANLFGNRHVDVRSPTTLPAQILATLIGIGGIVGGVLLLQG